MCTFDSVILDSCSRIVDHEQIISGFDAASATFLRLLNTQNCCDCSSKEQSL